jgi:hypothetical protein
LNREEAITPFLKKSEEAVKKNEEHRMEGLRGSAKTHVHVFHPHMCTSF